MIVHKGIKGLHIIDDDQAYKILPFGKYHGQPTEYCVMFEDAYGDRNAFILEAPEIKKRFDVDVEKLFDNE